MNDNTRKEVELLEDLQSSNLFPEGSPAFPTILSVIEKLRDFNRIKSQAEAWEAVFTQLYKSKCYREFEGTGEQIAVSIVKRLQTYEAQIRENDLKEYQAEDGIQSLAYQLEELTSRVAALEGRNNQQDATRLYGNTEGGNPKNVMTTEFSKLVEAIAKEYHWGEIPPKTLREREEYYLSLGQVVHILTIAKNKGALKEKFDDLNEKKP
jgi:hypothetical protein